MSDINQDQGAEQELQWQEAEPQLPAPAQQSLGQDLMEQDPSTLLQLAEKADLLVSAVKKIKSCVLAVTTTGDWIDEGGKPYLMASGAEKIRPLFGMDWNINDEPEVEVDEAGHRTYKFHGVFTVAGKSISAIGSRSSRDPFFSRSHGNDVDPKKINMANVEKAAYTNCIGNGITRALGIRNITWQELGYAGINRQDEALGKVERASGPIAPPFGDYAKQPLSQVSDDWLRIYLRITTENINDPKKIKFKALNEKLVSALNNEIDRRIVEADIAAALDEKAPPF